MSFRFDSYVGSNALYTLFPFHLFDFHISLYFLLLIPNPHYLNTLPYPTIITTDINTCLYRNLQCFFQNFVGNIHWYRKCFLVGVTTYRDFFCSFSEDGTLILRLIHILGKVERLLWD